MTFLPGNKHTKQTYQNLSTPFSGNAGKEPKGSKIWSAKGDF